MAAALRERPRARSRNVFVPLCVGGGIRGYTDSRGVAHTALDVAAAYFRSGAGACVHSGAQRHETRDSS